MSEIPTPRTDAAKQKQDQWIKRFREADSRGSHLDSDDPEPPNGWTVAHKLEQELAQVTAQCENLKEDAARLDWISQNTRQVGRPMETGTTQEQFIAVEFAPDSNVILHYAFGSTIREAIDKAMLNKP